MRFFVLLLLVSAAVTAAPSTASLKSDRIIGGSLTTINVYPSAASLLFLSGNSYWQGCGGTILNNRSILSAAHCTTNANVNIYRVRVGSTWANSGGVVHNVNMRIMHPNYNPSNDDNDFVVLRVASTILFNNNVATASIAGVNYNLGDNQQVWTVGWGHINQGGPSSEQLRHVQVWTVNQNVCAQRYAGGRGITANMLCAGWLDVGGRDACQGDSGGPLYHNNVVVGVTSWGAGCALPFFPGVWARVSRVTPWIQANA